MRHPAIVVKECGVGEAPSSDRATQRPCCSPKPLCDAYDVGMLDLDEWSTGATSRYLPRAALAEARRHGMTLAFVTNNASRTRLPSRRPCGHGGQASARIGGDVGQAVARLIAERLPDGGPGADGGGDGLDGRCASTGWCRCCSADDEPDAVVQGFSRAGLARPGRGLRSDRPGSALVRLQTDRTFPTARGIAPGNGTLRRRRARGGGRRPVVAGKPEPALFAETALRSGCRALSSGPPRHRHRAPAASAPTACWCLTGVTDLRAVPRLPRRCGRASSAGTRQPVQRQHRRSTTPAVLC
jgi:hypothetical protein